MNGSAPRWNRRAVLNKGCMMRFFSETSRSDILQTGQVGCCWSQMSMQFAWKECPQLGRIRNMSSQWYSARQTVHWVSSTAEKNSSLYFFVGKLENTTGSRPCRPRSRMLRSDREARGKERRVLLRWILAQMRRVQTNTMNIVLTANPMTVITRFIPDDIISPTVYSSPRKNKEPEQRSTEIGHFHSTSPLLNQRWVH